MNKSPQSRSISYSNENKENPSYEIIVQRDLYFIENYLLGNIKNTNSRIIENNTSDYKNVLKNSNLYNIEGDDDCDDKVLNIVESQLNTNDYSDDGCINTNQVNKKKSRLNNISYMNINDVESCYDIDNRSIIEIPKKSNIFPNESCIYEDCYDNEDKLIS